MRMVVQLGACLALGMFVALLILVGLMFAQQFEVIKLIMVTGKPLAHLALVVLPEGFWISLTGAPDALDNPSVRSFLQMCAALGQIALLVGGGLFRMSKAQ
ncbi:hypothetical protein ACVW0Y_002799 [Pseudomonas sp. TE3786]